MANCHNAVQNLKYIRELFTVPFKRIVYIYRERLFTELLLKFGERPFFSILNPLLERVAFFYIHVAAKATFVS